jgi:hypothetical protein
LNVVVQLKFFAVKEEGIKLKSDSLQVIVQRPEQHCQQLLINGLVLVRNGRVIFGFSLWLVGDNEKDRRVMGK